MATEKLQSYYSILGVTRNAPKDVIHRAYLMKARQCHPDLNRGEVKFHDRMSAINRAYATLSDVVSRINYDVRLTMARLHRCNE